MNDFVQCAVPNVESFQFHLGGYNHRYSHNIDSGLNIHIGIHYELLCKAFNLKSEISKKFQNFRVSGDFIRQ